MRKSAFQLRKATIADFPEFHQLFSTHKLHWLMIDYENFDSCSDSEEYEDNYFFTKEQAKAIENSFINFSMKDFEEHLKWYKIFMIEMCGEIVGYIKLENYSGRQIIREWPMKLEYVNTELLERILAKAEQFRTSKCKKLEVIAMSDKATEFLLKCGYSVKLKPFFEKSANQKRDQE